MSKPKDTKRVYFQSIEFNLNANFISFFDLYSKITIATVKKRLLKARELIKRLYF